MIGIVVVSHSRALARAAVALAQEMLQGRAVPIVIAAGLDEDTFGTDAVHIQQALVEADRDGDGVVVLMDLGSAVLSAELALELLDDDAARERVLLCPAPLVEGLVVAAVTALSGAGRDEVAAEAMAALAGKQSQLGVETGPARAEEPEPEPAAADPGAVTGRFTVTAPHGLHARPAARLVNLVRDLDAPVELRNLSTGSAWVPASSLSRVATLGVLSGQEVEVRAAGEQAGAALEQVLALAGRDFDEDDTPAPAGSPPVPVEPGTTGGPFPASPGIVVGPAIGAGRSGPAAETEPPEPGPSPADPVDADSVTENRRLDEALAAVRDQVRLVRATVARETGPGEAEIFDAHLSLLDDPELVATARSAISRGQAAGRAWSAAVDRVESDFRALTDPYLRARAGDVRDVGDQVLAHLNGDAAGLPVAGGPPGVLVAADLTPAQAATLNPRTVLAVVLAFGSPTAHSAILARARGIPAVVGAGPEVLSIAAGTVLAVDGGTGELVVDPGPEDLARFRARATADADRERIALSRAGGAARTRDGVEVLVGANVGSLDDARAAAAAGADLIGLVRTEFLFLGRSRAPEVEEQEAGYRALAEALTGRRITLRTLDVGGDKPLDYLPMPVEANPFLGVRGLRLALRRPELLADQLTAMVRVAHETPVSIMFPMVSTLAELVSARRALEDAIRRCGPTRPAGLQVGIMVEVPAAALKAATFAPHLDFLSIGTNDLTQYTLAAERGNGALAALADPLDPAVLRLIDATCRAAGPALVAVCGELAADQRAASVLVGLGVRELSVSPRAVPGIKQAVRNLVHSDAVPLAARALDVGSADAVRDLLSTDRPGRSRSTAG